MHVVEHVAVERPVADRVGGEIEGRGAARLDVHRVLARRIIAMHGHFFELVHAPIGYLPRKHTVNVLPGGKVTFDLTADAPGDWAFHCHNLYHMTAGMMRVVTVRPTEGAAA